MATDEDIVTAAVKAAESVVFSRYSRSEIRDLDVNVSFVEGDLSVDIYLNVPEADDTEHVANDAALAARSAVDDRFEP